MDLESFESLMKSRMDAGGIKPPKSVWAGISSALSERAIVSLQSSHSKHKWVAVAAIFVAVFSFALNADFKKVEAESTNQVSFNALLPTTEDHFRFFEVTSSPYEPVEYQYLWSNILFLKDNDEPRDIDKNFQPDTHMNEVLVAQEVFELEKIHPEIDEAAVAERYVSSYLVPQVRRTNGKTESQKVTYWAGVEAGAGNFNPTYSGADPIATNVDFDALASNLGQGGFVNPTSTATQSGMNDGIATSLGLDFGVKMGKRWAIESGIQYTRVENQTNASLNIVDAYVINASEVAGGDNSEAGSNRRTRVEENFDHSIDLDNSIRFTSIPLKAGYYLMNERLSLRLNAGLSANYFLSSRLTDPTGQLAATDQTGIYNEWSFDGLTGFEFGYSIFDNFNLTLEPNYIRSITPLSESLNTRSGFMVQTGLRYTIK